jgi:hypothetical protein
MNVEHIPVFTFYFVATFLNSIDAFLHALTYLPLKEDLPFPSALVLSPLSWICLLYVLVLYVRPHPLSTPQKEENEDIEKLGNGR